MSTANGKDRWCCQMINKVELLSLGEGKLKGKREVFKNPVKQLLSGLNLENIAISMMALFISRASIMDGFTPFGIAFLTAYLGRYGKSILIPIAATIGLITTQGFGGYGYITSIWAIYIISVFFMEKTKLSSFKLSLFAFISFVTINTLFLFLKEYFLYDLVMIVFQGITVFTLTYIFVYSISIIKGRNKVFTNEEIICGAIMLSLTISGLGDIHIYDFSVQNVIGIFLVIIFSFTKGPAIGTAVGVTIGVVCGMSTPNMPLLISVFGFSGLLAGLFKDLGKIGATIGFVLGNGIITFYINGYNEMFIKFQEVIIASIILFVLSSVIEKFDNKIMIGLSRNSEFKDGYSERLKDVTFNRLNEISQVFEELGATFKRVSDKEKIIEQKDISKFVNTVAEDVCQNCAMHRFCWENDFYTTYYSMFDVMNHIEVNGKIIKDRLPDNLKKRCIKTDVLCNKCNYLFDIYKVDYEWENRILESRQLVSEQLSGVSKIISQLANEIDSKITFKEDVEKTIYAALKNHDIDIKEVVVTESEKENFEIMLEVMPTNREDEDKCIRNIIPLVSDTVGFKVIRNKYSCSSPKDNRRIKFKLIRSNRYGAITKIAKSEESFNYVSGDSYTFGERKNNYFVALSDGMGTGQKANQESDITISLLEKFLEAGFDKELALKTINSILVLKSTEEIFSTIDMSIVDLYRGKTQFIKIGAAPTFIKKRREVKTINSNSLPVGILKDVDIQVQEEELEDGDFIIMMSDGILDANKDAEDKEAWMEEIICNIDSVNPQKIADTIVQKANEVSEGNERDDMTVLVTKIWRSRK